MRKIIERLIAILPAILLQILWYYVVYRILKDNNIALNIIKVIGMLLILNLIFEREESTYKILWIITIFSFPVLGAWFFFFFGKGQSAKKLEKRLNESRKKIKFKNITNPKIFDELKEDDERMYQTFKFFENKTKFPIEYVEKAEYFPIGEEMFRDNVNFLEKNDLFEQGMLALHFDRPLEAIKYLSLLEEEKNSAVSFNTALCYLKIKKYDKVLFFLEKALSEIKRNRNIEMSRDNYPELLAFEEENEAYINPMLYFTPLQFPDLAREQILRLMIDILFLLGKKEEMHKIINSLRNKNYKNVKDKISRS